MNLGFPQEQDWFLKEHRAFLKAYDQLADLFEKVFIRSFHAPTREQSEQLRQLSSDDPDYLAIQDQILAARTIFFLGRHEQRKQRKVSPLIPQGFVDRAKVLKVFGHSAFNNFSTVGSSHKRLPFAAPLCSQGPSSLAISR